MNDWSDPTWAAIYAPAGAGYNPAGAGADPPQIAVDETAGSSPPPVHYLDQLQAMAHSNVPLDQMYLGNLDG